MPKLVNITRRTMLRLLGSVSALGWASVSLAGCTPSPGGSGRIFLGMGARAGEVTATSAIIQARLTSSDSQDGDMLIPGAEGQARVIYGLDEDLNDARDTGWLEASEDKDYSVQTRIGDLQPASRHYYKVEMRADADSEVFTSDTRSFKTAPATDDNAPVHFQVTTCQTFDNGPTYEAMLAQRPDFLVSTGDNVYYDKGRPEWFGRTLKTAYNAYQRIYGKPSLIRFFDATSCYFMKDDHDYRFNDADAVQPGMWVQENRYDPKRARVTAEKEGRWYDEAWLTHEEGIEVVGNVFPAGEKNYRTFRWGRGVQVWLLEGRDYRSPNDMPDGPNKTIWGAEQKAWLKSTLAESDAAFRLVISPTPIVGPDKPGKTDNHVNTKGFYHEGQDFLNWLIDNGMTDNTFILCGDRHWQYHSMYKDRVHEFCCSVSGPEDIQDGTGIPTDHVVRDYFALEAGFLAARYDPTGKLTISICGTNGAPMFDLGFQA